MRSIILMTTALLSLACSAAPNSQNQRNSELYVTYNNREVHRSGTIYASREELTRLLSSEGKKYIIFGADWCNSCKSMYKAIRQSGHIDKVLILNLEEQWVNRLFRMTKLKHIPAMLVADKVGHPEKILLGPGPIILHLLINLKNSE